MDWVTLKRRVEMYYNSLIEKEMPLDQVTITAVICTFLSNTLGSEDFESTSDTHVRESLSLELMSKYQQLLKKILAPTQKEADERLEYWYTFLEDEMSERKFHKIARYDGDLLFHAIENLRKYANLDVYVSNYEKYGEKVWQEYRRLLTKE